MRKMITIPRQEYEELLRKAKAYDEQKAKLSKSNSIAGKASASKLTPEQRSERAKKAVEARIKKYGQKARNASNADVSGR